MHDGPLRVAILYPGNRETRDNANPENNRFADLFRAFAGSGIRAEPAVYNDDFCDEVRLQLLKSDGVLVWVNPLEGERGRLRLDAMLRAVTEEGVFVSTHPDIIMKLGTKEVLYRTRDIGWGCDTHVYGSIDQLRHELPLRLAAGKPRVLKQNRGNGGTGVWKVSTGRDAYTASHSKGAAPHTTRVRVQHAKRGCAEEELTLEAFFIRCEPYFATTGLMVDQEYQQRLPEGMIRCYLTHDKVVGFGHQAVNALFPAPVGTLQSEAPQPSPRYYHPATKPEFQELKHSLEQDWIPALQRLLDIEINQLPILWDCDFLFGPKRENGEDTYVLCEINVSSVAPYPESAVPHVVAATAVQLVASRRRRLAAE